MPPVCWQEIFSIVCLLKEIFRGIFSNQRTYTTAFILRSPSTFGNNAEAFLLTESFQVGFLLESATNTVFLRVFRFLVSLFHHYSILILSHIIEDT